MKRIGPARTVAAIALAVALLGALSIAAGAHRIVYFWKYDPRLFADGHSYRDHAGLKAWHAQWHRNHPGASDRKHRAFHHRTLEHTHQRTHHHDVLRKQQGQATWFSGETGACGKPLRGLYAAHPRWKCGALVSVRRGDRWVFVRILDRGPHGEGRVIDLSKRAFRRLAPLSRGVIDVRLYRLEP
jgi:rare lipoprotein A